MPFRLLFVAAALAAAGATSALAGGYSGERVYADAYGNLVIHSRAGFKRILVGRGEMAADYAQLGVEAPHTAYLERHAGKLYLRRAAPCSEGVLVKGRGYMYGLPDGVLPVLVAPCR
ncbi:hypothetical protein [Nitratireductor sp. ZSWI3]|uniref:hypothetical protein n=1 Tax=Nitratireductor sp. ZSWI3 TaxID=2966359 RepID=UPI00214F63FF|nr:hypothetical protein [Nitratireductor sp. ZSWI3]MCR4268139.1 hypothetical protein [Nitratireductor sp. ZSWI3]